MATDWIQEQQDAYNDLLDDGAVFSFTRQTNTKPDPISGLSEDSIIELFQAPGILKQIGQGRAQRWYREFADLIQVGDELLLVSAKTYTPAIGDSVHINGIDWIVESFSVLRPAVVPLLYYLLIRKA